MPLGTAEEAGAGKTVISAAVANTDGVVLFERAFAAAAVGAPVVDVRVPAVLSGAQGGHDAEDDGDVKLHLVIFLAEGDKFSLFIINRTCVVSLLLGSFIL